MVVHVTEPAHIFLHNPSHLLAWLISEYSTGRVNEGELKPLVMRLKGDLVLLWCQILHLKSQLSLAMVSLSVSTNIKYILQYWRNKSLNKITVMIQKSEWMTNKIEASKIIMHAMLIAHEFEIWDSPVLLPFWKVLCRA